MTFVGPFARRTDRWDWFLDEMVKGVTTTADVVRLRPPMNRVSPRALWYWAARAAVLWIVLLVPR